MTLNLDLRKIPSEDKVLYISFNQDNRCFAVGTDAGFVIYQSEPFKELYRRNTPSGGIGIVEMLFRSKVLALVGGGERPCWTPDRVQVWDDQTCRVVSVIKLSEVVKAVKLLRDKIFVATESEVRVYKFDDSTVMHTYSTIANPLGVIAVSPSTSRCVLVCPSLEAGVVRIADLTDDACTELKVHESGVAMLTLNHDGTLVATASERGTLIRVFDTVRHDMVREMRRGSVEAVIHSLCFSPDAAVDSDGQATGWVACTSSNGTLHVFSLAEDGNRKSSFASLAGYVSSYFSSEWSFAWWRGPECPAMCVFGPEGKPGSPKILYVVSSDGSFHMVHLDTAKGEEMQSDEPESFPNPSKPAVPASEAS